MSAALRVILEVVHLFFRDAELLLIGMLTRAVVLPEIFWDMDGI